MKKIKNYFDKLLTFLDTNSLSIVIIISVIASILTDIWSFKNGYITAYADAQAHLVIARRVFDNLTPGIAQLGGVWLPLYHILILPFVFNNFLYRSGLAGTLISSASFIFSSITLFKLIEKFLNNKNIAFIGSLIFVLNPNILYMQSSSMTEITCLFFILITAYYFLVWREKRNLHDLIILSGFVFFGTLTRYENWIIALATFVAIGLTILAEKMTLTNKVKEVESQLLIFCYVGFFGIILWFLWNLLIFHNPLYFLHSVWSAEAFQKETIKAGLNKPYKNIYYAIKYYLYSVADNGGWVLVILGFIGSIYSIFKNRITIVLSLIIITFSVFVFETYSLFKGNTTIFLPELFPHDYYNIRYGLYSFPFFILFASSLLTTKNNIVRLFITLTIILSISYLLYFFNPITLVDAMVSRNGNAGYEKEAPSYVVFLQKNYSGGLLLISSGVSSNILLETNIDLKNFITEGNQKYWNESLEEPSKYATYVILNKDTTNIRNLLAIDLLKSKKLDKHFDLIFSDKGILIYKKIK